MTTRKKWSFLFTVCLVTALIVYGQKNSQVDKIIIVKT